MPSTGADQVHAEEPWDPALDEAQADSAGAGLRRVQPRWWALIAAFLVIASGIVIWFGVEGTRDTITSQVVTYASDERSLSATIEVTRPAGTEVVCTLTAVDPKHASVGTVDVTIPASADRSSRADVEILTTTRSTNIVIEECRAG